MYQIEVTDTFGGEANYCWVKRWTASSEAQAVKEARAEIRSFGCKRTFANECGDLTIVRPPASKGPAVIAFVTWEDDEQRF